MELRPGDKVELYKIDSESSYYKEYIGNKFTIRRINEHLLSERKYAELIETCNIKPYIENLRLIEEKYTGIILLQKIKEGKVKNCDIKVYKNNSYQFTIKCSEKSILDNSQFHVGMLISDKYTYEPIKKKEMTISEIEKELGYAIKIVK